jgi:hypothetical protein
MAGVPASPQKWPKRGSAGQFPALPASTVHYVGAPAHVDGKVFRAMATPIYVRLEREALGLIDFAP